MKDDQDRLLNELTPAGSQARGEDYIRRNYKICPACKGRNRSTIYIAKASPCCTMCETENRENAEMKGIASIIPDASAFMKAPATNKRPHQRNK